MPCNNECKLGCNGTGIFECNQCRSYKLKLEDLIQIIQSLAADKRFAYSQEEESLPFNQKQIQQATRLIKIISENGLDSFFKESDKENLLFLIKSYLDYFVKKEYWSESQEAEQPVVFCVSECPSQIPFQSSDFFCISEKPNK